MMKKFLLIAATFMLPFSSFAQVANDDCSNAQAVALPASGSTCFTASNVGALSDNSTNACDVGAAGNEIWYTYIATGANNTITVTPTGATPATDLVITYHLASTNCTSGSYSQC